MQSVLDWTGAVASIVVFAGLLEILVPSSSMKRYVQLTMGLLVLLVLLGPVLGVLQRTRDLGWETEAAWSSPALSLDAVLSKADDIREGNRLRQVEVYRSSLEQAAVRAAVTALSGRSAAAQVLLGEPPPQGGPPPVKRIVLAVGPEAATTAAAPPEAVGMNAPGLPWPNSPGMTAPVAPVRPVEIDRSGPPVRAGAPFPGEAGTASAGAGSASSDRTTGGLAPATVTAVRRAVAEALGLDPALIEIHGNSREE